MQRQRYGLARVTVIITATLAIASFATDQYYDILAFDLKANGVDVSNKKIDPMTAAEIKLH